MTGKPEVDRELRQLQKVLDRKLSRIVEEPLARLLERALRTRNGHVRLMFAPALVRSPCLGEWR